MHIDDLPVKFMGVGESGKSQGKRLVRVPWAQGSFICHDCRHRWEKPDDVVVGD
jgi:hypothetical protein